MDSDSSLAMQTKRKTIKILPRFIHRRVNLFIYLKYLYGHSSYVSQFWVVRKNIVKSKETIKPAFQTAKIKLECPNQLGLTYQL